MGILVGQLAMVLDKTLIAYCVYVSFQLFYGFLYADEISRESEATLSAFPFLW